MPSLFFSLRRLNSYYFPEIDCPAGLPNDLQRFMGYSGDLCLAPTSAQNRRDCPSRVAKLSTTKRFQDYHSGSNDPEFSVASLLCVAYRNRHAAGWTSSGLHFFHHLPGRLGLILDLASATPFTAMGWLSQCLEPIDCPNHPHNKNRYPTR